MTDTAHVLALQHEAVWLYGLIGGRFPAVRALAVQSWETHRTVRDELLTQVPEPVPPQPFYEPATLPDVDAARAAAQDVEARIAAGWLGVVGSTRGDQRRRAIEHLATAEQARLDWGGDFIAFPGTT